MEEKKLNQLLMLVFNYGKKFERTQDIKYGLENAIRDFKELDNLSNKKINPTTQKYYNILLRYWHQTMGERILLIYNKKGKFVSNSANLIKIFADREEIDGVVSKLFFDKKILIARPLNGYYGITCAKEPTLKMADSLRLEANGFKYKSKEKVDKVKQIEKSSRLF